MTSFTGFTSDEYQLLKDLIAQAKDLPAAPSAPTAGVFDGLKEIIQSVVQGIVDGATTAIKTTVNNVTNTVSGFVTNAVTDLKTKIDTVVDDVVEGVTGTFNDIWETIKDLIGDLVGKIQDVINAVKGIATDISNALSNALSGIAQNIKDVIKSTIASAAGFVDDAINTVSGWIEGVVNRIVEGYNSLKETVKNWIDTTYQSIKETVENIVNSLKETYTTVKETIEDKIQKLLTWIGQVKDDIVTWFNGVKSALANWLATVVMPKIQSTIDGAKTLVELGQTVWGFIAAGDYQKAFDVVDGFAKGLGIPAPVKTIQAIISTISYFYLSIQLQFVPMQVRAQKLANINLGLDPISIDAAAQGYFKGATSLSGYFENARLGGVTQERAKVALEATRPLPTPGQVQEAFLRGEIDLSEHDKLLTGYGFTKENIDLIKSLYLLIPGPSDLIRMAVREAFTPEIAEKFGQYEDYPVAFTQWAEKQGITKDWAERYWAAHWELPSPSMGFEMLHRGIIENQELTLLLRALDIMPYWRERLIKLSYNPLTRVDVRRMYQFGVIDENQVKRSYLDLGYDDEKASWLTEFTKRYSAPEDQTELDTFKAMAKTTYSQAYKRKIISREEYTAFLLSLKYHPDDVELLIQLDDFAMLQDDKLFNLNDVRKDMRKLILNGYNEGLLEVSLAKSMLIDLGYDDNESEVELSVIDYNRSLLIKSMVVDAMHEQFTGFIIDEVQLHEVMGMFNFSGLEIDKLVETWNIEKAFRTKRPSLTDIRRFYTQGLITLDDFLNELRGQGYHERYIDLYSRSLQTT